MPEIVLDCQRLQCPDPVIRTKRLLEAQSPEELIVIVDNEPAQENVTRFLTSQGYSVSSTPEPGRWLIAALKKDGADAASQPEKAAAPLARDPETMKTLLMVISPVFGSGDDELGKLLMKKFLATLPEMGKSLWRIVLLNGGVTLALTGSHVIAELRELEAAGVDIFVCGLCLEHFGYFSQKAVGETTNMLDVLTSMQVADKVIRI
jgi:selenium metabolism protein YedF